MNRRRQEDKETTTTGIMTTITTTCHCVWGHGYYYLKEDERVTSTGDMTGLGEGTTTTTITRMTATTTILQDRLKARKSKQHTMTLFNGIIRLLTDLRRYFSHSEIPETGILRKKLPGRGWGGEERKDAQKKGDE